ncbi:uncharacterized protein ACRADG_006111 [Cochliomyia hominivorax]
MLEIKKEENTENEQPKEDKENTEETTTEVEAAAEAAPEPPPQPPQNETQEQQNDTQQQQQQHQQQQHQQQQHQQQLQQQHQQSNEGTLNPLNDLESNTDAETKNQKHRRYWTPKEEEKFYEIWGRENWRLTRHGKNTIFFAKWSEEMKERFNIDVKPEEVQCKVNQTRAKFRQVKKNLENDRNAVKWKKYDIVERILKNQYRSKDDEPVPPEAMENNRDVSPTELYNCATQPSSPNSISNISNLQEHNINLSQSHNTDHQLTDEVNMSSASLSDQNLYCNNSQSGNNFSTELFGSDQLEIKQEIENDLKNEGFSDLTITGSKEDHSDGSANNIDHDNQSQFSQVPHTTSNENSDNSQIHSSNPNSLLLQNRLVQNHNNNNTHDGIVNYNNHSSMQPPRSMAVAASPRKRNRSSSISSSGAPITSETLETLYLEEVRKKNVLLVEQGEINRKRLRLEERKVKLMEEFFPKFMNLQQEILQKLDSVTNTNSNSNTNTTTEISN